MSEQKVPRGKSLSEMLVQSLMTYLGEEDRKDKWGWFLRVGIS